MIGRAYNFAWHDEEMRAVKKYPEFIDLMLRRFDNEPESLRLEKFMAAKQETKEDVREFASRLRALGAKTIPKFEAAGAAESRAAADSVLQRQLLSLYVHELRDPVRRYLLSKGPTSFTDAVEAAAAEERNEKLVAPGAALRAVDARDEKNETDSLSASTGWRSCLLTTSLFSGRRWRGVSLGIRQCASQCVAGTVTWSAIE